MTAKIFGACFFGALVGALVALQMYESFWWLGLIAGALAGYASFEYKAIITAIPRAYRAARGWQPDREVWWARFKHIFGVIGLCQSVLVVFLLPLWSTPKEVLTHPFPAFILAMHVAGLLVALTILPKRDADGEVSQIMYGYTQSSPLFLLFWQLPKGILWCVKRIPVTIEVVIMIARCTVLFWAHFAKFLFREIHSDVRLLCACNAAIGAAIGYTTENAILGALAGGVLGVVNYELISKRLLGLVPR